MNRDVEAGSEPENRAGVLRDVGLIEGDDHDRPQPVENPVKVLCSFDELRKQETALPSQCRIRE
jgi:hypothetical protein